MLQSAAAARTKMLADRFNTLMARLVDMQQVPAIRMATDELNCDRLPGQSVRYIDGPFWCVRDTISTMAETVYRELLSHVQPRARIRRCRHRPGSARG